MLWNMKGIQNMKVMEQCLRICDVKMVFLLLMQGTRKGFARQRGNFILAKNGPLRVNIFPNPNKGQFVVEINEKDTQTSVNVKIKNILGYQLIELQSFSNKIPIDMSPYSRGIYLIEIETANQKTILQSIKQ